MNSQDRQAPQVGMYRRGPHVAAVMTAVLLIPLLFVGAGVTSKGAGMAFPDWPTSSGHLLNPPHWWQSDATRWEHGHRLIGWTVGMLAMVTATWCWRSGGLPRYLGISCLAAIAAQGILGGIRVREDSAVLAMIHGIWGQIAFCAACSVAAVTARSWCTENGGGRLPAARFLQRLCLATTAALLIQTALGAGVRHFDCPYALVSHLLLAVILAMMIGWMAMWLIGAFSRNQMLGFLARVLAVMTALQLFAGGMTFVITKLTQAPSPMLRWAVPSIHVVIGALLLACSLLITMTAYKMIRPLDAAREMIPAGTVPA